MLSLSISEARAKELAQKVERANGTIDRANKDAITWFPLVEFLTSRDAPAHTVGELNLSSMTSQTMLSGVEVIEMMITSQMPYFYCGVLLNRLKLCRIRVKA